MVWQRLGAQHSRSSALLARISRFALVAFVVVLFVSAALFATTHAALAQDIDTVQDEVDAILATPPTWTDSFREDDGAWEVDESSDSSFLGYVSSNYRVGVTAEQIYAWGVADYFADNVLVEVDAYSIDGEVNNEFGIVLRHEDIQNFYTFLASSDGTYTLRALVDGGWVDMVPWSVSTEIDQEAGAVNRVGAYANGSTLALIINGTVVAVYQDDAFASGAIGLAAGSFDVGGIEIGFDDISVWNLDELSDPVETPVAVPTEEATVTATAESTPEPTEEATAEVATPEPLETPVLEEPATPEPIDILGVLDAVRNGDLTVRDNFSRDQGAWDLLLDDSSAAEIASRVLSVHIADPNWLAWATLNDLSPAEFLVEVDASQTDGAEDTMYGVVFHLIDDANFDYFAVASDGRWSYWRLADNAWEEVQPWTESDAIEQGLDAENRLAVLAQNGAVTLIANDTALGEFDLDTTTSGRIGLGVGTLDEGDATVQFDNFDLWALDEGANAQGTPEATAEATEEAVVPTEEATAEDPTVEVTEEAVAATVEPTEEATAEATEEATAEATAEATEEAVAEETPVPESTEVAESLGSDAQAAVAALLATEPVYTSEFRRDDGSWSMEKPEDEGIDHYYEGRQLHLWVDAENWLTWSTNADAAGNDFYVQVEATQALGPEVNEYGLAFRMQDDDNFYAFFVSGNGYWNVSKLVDGEWITLNDWTESSDIAGMEETNTLGVLAEGDTLTLFVNGAQLGQVTDDAFSEGGFALLTGTFDEPSVNVAFDNFAVYAAGE